MSARIRSSSRGPAWLALAFGAATFAVGAGAEAKPAKAEKPAASASAAAGAPSAAPAATTAPSTEAKASLPPGHPPIDGAAPAGPDEGAAVEGKGLPPGHPEVDAAGGAPARGAARAGMFQPPADVAIDDPSVPAGELLVTLKDTEERPIPRAPVTLSIVQSSVAKGESRERMAREADDEGRARFEGLTGGSGVSYQVAMSRGPATFTTEPFLLSSKVGKRVVLHGYEVSSRIEDVVVAIQGIVYVSMREDAFQVEQLLSVFNMGRVAWAPDGATITLPQGFKAWTKPEATGEARVDEVPGKGAVLRGTFPPGRHDVSFRYQVPLEHTERQTLEVALPPRVAQVRLMVEASSAMGLEAAGFPAAQRSQGQDGKRLLVTEKAATRAEGGIAKLALTVTGLPTQGPGRWIAAGIGACLMLAGALYRGRRTAEGELDPDVQRDLLEAQAALLDEIVALERAHQKGEIGPKTYARVRAALLDALSRIVERLPAAPAHKASAKRPELRRGVG